MRIYIIVTLLLLILGCQNKDEKDSQKDNFSNNQEKCLCEELMENEAGKLVRNGVLFSGNCEVKYLNSDQTYIEKQVLDGELNGAMMFYNKRGKLIYEEKYEFGNYKIDTKQLDLECNCKYLEKRTGQEVSMYFYDGNVYTGICTDKYPNSDQNYIRSTFNNGYLDGLKTYYDKFGNILYHEIYLKGALTKTIYQE